MLFVTRGTFNETAWAAISISMEPIGVPAFQEKPEYLHKRLLLFIK